VNCSSVVGNRQASTNCVPRNAQTRRHDERRETLAEAVRNVVGGRGRVTEEADAVQGFPQLDEALVARIGRPSPWPRRESIARR
jgi:hypothetical protein